MEDSKSGESGPLEGPQSGDVAPEQVPTPWPTHGGPNAWPHQVPPPGQQGQWGSPPYGAPNPYPPPYGPPGHNPVYGPRASTTKIPGWVIALIAIGIMLPFIGGIVLGVVNGMKERRAAEAAEAATTKLTASSDDNAKRPIVDEDYRFRLNVPAVDWKMVHDRDLKFMAPDALAGAVNNDANIMFFVSAEELPGAELEAYARATLAQGGYTEDVMQPAESLAYKGLDAVRMRAVGALDGMQQDSTVIVFERDGFVFTLIGTVNLVTGKHRVQELQAAFDAFQPLPGVVKGRAVPIDRADRSGVGWLVRDGELRSVAFGLKASPADGWAVLGGDEAHDYHSFGEVVLTSARPQTVIAIVPWKAPPGHGGHDTIRNSTMNEWGNEPTDQQFIFRAFSRDVTFYMYRGTDPALPQEYLAAVVPTGDLLLELLVWYPEARRKEAHAHLASGLAALGTLSPGERDLTDKELVELGQTGASQLGATDVYRGGVYRDFDSGLVWRAPDQGYWRARIGAQVTPVAPADLVFIEEPGVDLRGSLGAVPDADPASFHRAIVDDFITDALPRPDNTPLRWGDVTAQVSKVQAEVGGISHQYLVATAVTQGRGYYGVVYYPNYFGDAGERQARSALAALQIDQPMAPTQTFGTHYRDVRMGVEVQLPAGWRFTPLPINLSAEAPASMVMGQSGDQMMLLVAVQTQRLDDAWTSDFVEQLLRTKFQQLDIGAPEKTDIEIAGVDGRRFRYRELLGEELDVFVFHRQGVLYLLLSGGQSSAQDLTKDVKLFDLPYQQRGITL